MKLTISELSLLIQVCEQVLDGTKDEEVKENFKIIKDKLVNNHYNEKTNLYGRKSVQLNFSDEAYNSEAD